MTRAARAVAATASALLSLVLVPAASDAGPKSSKIIETIWHVTSASGTQTLTMSGADPDQGLDSFTASITSRWRTTTKRNSTMTFGWPVPKVGNFPDPRTFASLIKPKVEMVGSASGTVDVNGTPTPFSCQNNTGKNIGDFLPVDTVPISGGSLSSAKLGIGAILHSNPEVLFDGCPGPQGLSVHAILSPEQLDTNKPTYKPIPLSHLKHGHKGEKQTLSVRVTAPVVGSGGAQVGKLVSKATIHLKFGVAV
jgi:hypothetical protein